jgi:DNA-binding response OmpR family regulator
MKKKILIVDDDVSVRDSLRKVLAEAGYEVVTAPDGERAAGLFNETLPDLLLLDIGLPLKNGWDTFERITTEHPLVPVIIITGQACQFDTALAAGVGALMEKPLDAPQLLKVMEELLAEPDAARLSRLCGLSQDTRHRPPANTRFLRKLREHYAPPARMHLTAHGRGSH